ncbi:MAG: ATP-binding protein [Opitutaceae bacterium]|jgi:predicted AAA+ superfamily ATPase|nr:ATP-binding protein [Opitutaceae bacterium]
MSYLPRYAERLLKEYQKVFKATLLLGPRQCGKTTLLKHLFPDVPMVTFDPVEDIQGARRDPDGFLRNFPPPLIIDEAQYAPELFPALKRFMDARDEKGQYFLTGSQNPLMLRQVAEGMPGRVGILEIGHMDATELAGLGDHEPWLKIWLGDKGAAFPQKYTTLPKPDAGAELRALWRGGMPGLLDTPDNLIQRALKSYFNTYLERDVRVVSDIADVPQFANFAALCAALTAQEINLAQFGRDIGAKPQTVRRWLGILQATYQWHALRPFTRNAIKRLSGKPKGHLSDTGLACLLQYIDNSAALNVSPLKGAFFETWVANSVKKQFATLDTEPGFFHWRTLAGAEADIVLELGGTHYLVEAKSKTHIDGHDTSGVRAFRKTYNEPDAPAVIVHTGDTCRALDAHTLAMPWNAIPTLSATQ